MGLQMTGRLIATYWPCMAVRKAAGINTAGRHRGNVGINHEGIVQIGLRETQMLRGTRTMTPKGPRISL